MGELIRKHGVDTEQQQAVYFHARERRRSLAGVVELFRTHRFSNTARTLTITGATNATPIVITSVGHGLIDGMTVTVADVEGNTAANGTWAITVVTADTFSLDTSVGNGAYTTGGTAVVTPAMPVPSIDTGAVFPVRSGLITFTTAIRITGAAPLGMVFEFGSSTRGCGLAVAGALMAGTGGGNTTEAATAIFDYLSTMPVGLELELVLALRPGTGEVRLWGNGQELARAAASSGSFGGDWADTEAGSFAQVAAGTVPAGISIANQDPVDFDVIQPLSVYVGQVPRQFV